MMILLLKEEEEEEEEGYLLMLLGLQCPHLLLLFYCCESISTSVVGYKGIIVVVAV